MREKKCIKVTFRLTEDEAERLAADMSLSGYNSRSRYIRHILLERKTRRRYLSRSDGNLARQVEQLWVEIKRIGINYNQRVKALNTLARLRDRHGRPVVTAHDVDHDMMDMKRMMQAMVDKVNRIAADVATNFAIEDENEADAPEEGEEPP